MRDFSKKSKKNLSAYCAARAPAKRSYKAAEADAAECKIEAQTRWSMPTMLNIGISIKGSLVQSWCVAFLFWTTNYETARATISWGKASSCTICSVQLQLSSYIPQAAAAAAAAPCQKKTVVTVQALRPLFRSSTTVDREGTQRRAQWSRKRRSFGKDMALVLKVSEAPGEYFFSAQARTIKTGSKVACTCRNQATHVAVRRSASRDSQSLTSPGLAWVFQVPKICCNSSRRDLAAVIRPLM